MSTSKSFLFLVNVGRHHLGARVINTQEPNPFTHQMNIKIDSYFMDILPSLTHPYSNKRKDWLVERFPLVIQGENLIAENITSMVKAPYTNKEIIKDEIFIPILNKLKLPFEIIENEVVKYFYQFLDRGYITKNNLHHNQEFLRLCDPIIEQSILDAWNLNNSLPKIDEIHTKQSMKTRL